MTVKHHLISQIETLPEEAVEDFLDHLHLFEIEEAGRPATAWTGSDLKMDRGERR